MRGVVQKVAGGSYWVLTDEGEILLCRVRGKYRLRGIQTTAPAVVGDRVVIETSPDSSKGGDSNESFDSSTPSLGGGRGEVYWITEVEDRKNYIIRRSINLSKQSQIIAANLDLVALLVTINHPQTNLIFIDRFLATAEAYRVPALLIFNKIDLLTEQEKWVLEDWQNLYEGLGYPCVQTSFQTSPPPPPKEGALSISALNTPSLGGGKGEVLRPYFADKTVLLSGNSGVGKSTLLNALLGEERAKVGALSAVHDAGMHTTTFSEMYRWAEANSWIIDTPGIKGFGSYDMQRTEISHYFKEIFHVGQQCRFSDCTHTNEKGCAVLPAVERGEIAVSRYESYLSMLGDENEGKYR